jgi:hypothetical protein
MRYAIEAIAVAILIASGPAKAQKAAAELAVNLINASQPTLCAEVDNVNLTLASSQVKSFSIEARHPAYIGTLVADRSAPDFRNCDMTRDPAFPAPPRRVTVYENETWQLIGHVFPSFWRDSHVPVTVGTRTETGLHLLQLWTRFNERAEEVLVLYPADGYWRARPLPPPHLGSSAYGSSFLVGPIETATRPYVDISKIAFDPSERRFTLTFAAGGEATLRVAELDRDHIRLAVTLAPPVASRPFAAIRSMYVTRDNADAADVAWIGPGAKGWNEAPIMKTGDGKVTALQVSRTLPSRHNTSAPDLLVDEFR